MENEKVKNRGGRNLTLLGLGAILVAFLTSFVSLYVYHASGDIYLDCSLPGADCPSARSDSEENNREDVYVFSDSGNINEAVLEEYLKEIKTPAERLEKIGDPFSSPALSDESLGI